MPEGLTLEKNMAPDHEPARATQRYSRTRSEVVPSKSQLCLSALTSPTRHINSIMFGCIKKAVDFRFQCSLQTEHASPDPGQVKQRRVWKLS